MRALVFSDLHWFHNRISYLLETCSWLASEIREQEPNVVVFCGDLNHTHGYVDVETLEAMSRGMSSIVKACDEENIPLHLLSGNHDQASKDGVENVLAVFEEFSKAHCYTTRAGATKFDRNTTAVFCPYPPTVEKDRKAHFDHLRSLVSVAIGQGHEVVMFTHWDITGIPYRPGDRVREGVHSIARETAGSVSLIVNGHYHHPVIYEGNPPVVIVGSPCYHNYADSLVESPRGYTILDNDTPHRLRPSGESRFDVVGGWGVLRCENPHGPIYHTLPVEDLEDYKIFLLNYKDRLKLRVVVEDQQIYLDSRETILEIQEHVSSLRVVGRGKVQIAMDEDTPLPPSFDVTDILDDFLSSVETSLDKDRLRDRGRQLVEEFTGATT